jgi:hypothetical protein
MAKMNESQKHSRLSEAVVPPKTAKPWHEWFAVKDYGLADLNPRSHFR